MSTKSNGRKPRQPNVTRVYHIPGKGTVVEHVYSKPVKRHRLTAEDKRRMEELKRREGFYDLAATGKPVTRIVDRSGGRWAKPAKRRKPAARTKSNGKRNGRKKAA